MIFSFLSFYVFRFTKSHPLIKIVVPLFTHINREAFKNKGRATFSPAFPGSRSLPPWGRVRVGEDLTAKV